MAQVRELLTLLEEIAPGRLAADWDNCGLMVGNKDQQVDKVALALEATKETVATADLEGAQVLITHHPLMFKPLKNLDLADPTAATLALAIKTGVTVVSAHTNLDAAAQGVAYSLTKKLDLVDLGPLEPQTQSPQYKIAVFVPLGYEGQCRTAMFQAGAGRIGNYSGCSFASRGEGTFFPEPEANPFLGTVGQLQRVQENRLEVVVGHKNLEAVIQALRDSHPYEESAFDVYPLAGTRGCEGFGRLTRLPDPGIFKQIITLVKERLSIPAVRVLAPKEESVQTIALMPGSGGSYVRLAKARGAQVLITGDVSYHQAREAEQIGLGIIDAGHFATEFPALVDLSAALSQAAQAKNLDLSFSVLNLEHDPWSFSVR